MPIIAAWAPALQRPPRACATCPAGVVPDTLGVDQHAIEVEGHGRGSHAGSVEWARVPPQRPSDTSSVLTRWMGITDANTAGFVHGGVIMRLCDEVAGLAAIRHCHGRAVTAGMDRMTFLEPVHVAHLVTFRATVDAAWRTSMEVGVRVESENVRSGEARALLERVSDDGRDRRAGPAGRGSCALPETDEERRREVDAQLRRENRLAEREAIRRSRAADD